MEPTAIAMVMTSQKHVSLLLLLLNIGLLFVNGKICKIYKLRIKLELSCFM